jgi:hypothetical protein
MRAASMPQLIQLVEINMRPASRSRRRKVKSDPRVRHRHKLPHHFDPIQSSEDEEDEVIEIGGGTLEEKLVKE